MLTASRRPRPAPVCGKAAHAGPRYKDAVDHETADEIKRHFCVVAEGLRSEIRVVAEGLTAFREESKRDNTALRQEMRPEFDEVKAMIRFSHAELDRRETRCRPRSGRTMPIERLRSRVLIPLLALVASGCVELSPQAEAVNFYRWAPTVEWLTARDRVFATCTLMKTEDFGANGGPITRSHVREYAARIHADTVSGGSIRRTQGGWRATSPSCAAWERAASPSLQVMGELRAPRSSFVRRQSHRLPANTGRRAG
jgi:hypothetical protein